MQTLIFPVTVGNFTSERRLRLNQYCTLFVFCSPDHHQYLLICSASWKHMNHIVPYYIMPCGDANYFTVKLHTRIISNAGSLQSVITDIS
jgi:hypothetical protein